LVLATERAAAWILMMLRRRTNEGLIGVRQDASAEVRSHGRWLRGKA
jgi:hypothetical protein